MKMPSRNLQPRYSGNITNLEQNMILLLSQQYLHFVIVSFFLWCMVILCMLGIRIINFPTFQIIPALDNRPHL